MKIHNIKVTNFKSMYGEHYFDFDSLEGLVKLSGPIGAGKTALGECILCGLFGKVKDHTNPNMVAWGTDTYEIELNLTSKGHEINIIRNPKKQLEVHIDGKLLSATGKNDMQTILEEFYDVPRMAVEKMCIISFNAFNSLAAMSAYETKTFLDDIFGFKTFTEYNNEVIVERREQLAKQTELNALFQDAKSQITYLERKRDAQQAELSNSVDITGLDEERSKLVEDGKNLKKDCDSLQSELTALQRTHSTARLQFEAKKSEAATLGKIQKDSYEKFKAGKCPTCGHAIEAGTISAYKEKMDQYASQWHEINNELKKQSAEWEKEESGLQTRIADLQKQMSDLRTRIQQIDQKVKMYNSSKQLINENYDDLISSYEAKRSNLAEQITECDKEIGEWNEMNDLFTKTLRYKLLDTLIPHINLSIQYYMDKLEQGYRVQFDQEFKPHIFTDNISGEISYKDLSTGQRKTLDIAIIFGILQNIISNVNFNVFFLDELMSNLDADSRNTMLSVLQDTLSDGRVIFIINHAEMSDDFFTHKIRVSLHNKRVELSKKKLKNAVETGDTEIVARASKYELIPLK